MCRSSHDWSSARKRIRADAWSVGLAYGENRVHAEHVVSGDVAEQRVLAWLQHQGEALGRTGRDVLDLAHLRRLDTLVALDGKLAGAREDHELVFDCSGVPDDKRHLAGMNHHR